jgi:hypothetical protein
MDALGRVFGEDLLNRVVGVGFDPYDSALLLAIQRRFADCWAAGGGR